MFVDEVVLTVIGGSGGDGCSAFRREKYVPLGGPSGGNGGKGSNIIFEVDEGLSTLLDIKYKKKIIGEKGKNGQGKGMHGRHAEDIVIKVPQGTIITDLENNFILADLKHQKDQVIVAKGGRGGRGNQAFKTKTNTGPTMSENGEPGEERKIKIELKLLADVGLVGMPSVGKSTLISKISNSKPKIAEYHFTTLTPNLGVVKYHEKIFVVADIPGLIEGAAKGEGLGIDFLKHIERTKIIVHIIDMSAFEERDPYNDYLIIENELASYSKKLASKPRIIVANKMDLANAEEQLKVFKKKIKEDIIEISALASTGVDALLKRIAETIDIEQEEELFEEEEYESHVLYKFKEEKPFLISKENNVWHVHGEQIEKLIKMTKFSSDEAAYKFAKKLKSMGIDEELSKMGAQDGDNVRVVDYEFEYHKED